MKRKILATILGISMAITSCMSMGCTIKLGSTKEVETAVEKRSYAAGDKVTVESLKEKYGEVKEDDNKVQPMYSINQDEPFVFTFPYKLGDIAMDKVASIHSDIECKEESRIITNYNYETTSDNKSKVTIDPSICSLTNEQIQKDINNSVNKRAWGNLAIYYLKISYDNTTSEPKELEEPTIIPFTVKSKLDTPNVYGNINDKGVFNLSWQEVENAESYNIYKVGGSFADSQKEGTYAAKKGYNQFGISSAKLIANTKETKNVIPERDDSVYNRTKDGLQIISDSCKSQNCGFDGEYYVTAVDKDGNESNFSQGVDSFDYKDVLPEELEEGPNRFKTYESINDLPTLADVKMIYGETKTYPITYKINETQNATTGNDIAYDYSISGTGFYGKIKLKNGPTSELPKNINQDPNGVQDVAQDESKVNNIPENKEEASKGDVDKQREKTKSDVKDGNKESLKVEEDIYFNADSSAEEWIAVNMINGEEHISLKGYPELSSGERLSDVLDKVYYQNPYITKCQQIDLDYEKNELVVKYVHSKEEIKKMNSEIAKEAKKVINENIKDGMSDEEKVEAIYDYLNDNTEYDDEVLEEAAKNNYRLPPDKFPEAFETYGILCKKKGVCQSYAFVVRLLCDLVGVDCVQVVGTTTECGHAWNKVKLDDKWYNIDCTNSEKNIGVKKLFYLNTDQTSESAGTFQEDTYCLDEDLSKYQAKDDDKEYYSKNGMCAKGIDEYEKILDEHFDDGDKVVVRCADTKNIKPESLKEKVSQVCKKHKFSGAYECSYIGEYIYLNKKPN